MALAKLQFLRPTDKHVYIKVLPFKSAKAPPRHCVVRAIQHLPCCIRSFFPAKTAFFSHSHALICKILSRTHIELKFAPFFGIISW